MRQRGHRVGIMAHYQAERPEGDAVFGRYLARIFQILVEFRFCRGLAVFAHHGVVVVRQERKPERLFGTLHILQVRVGAGDFARHDGQQVGIYQPRGVDVIYGVAHLEEIGEILDCGFVLQQIAGHDRLVAEIFGHAPAGVGSFRRLLHEYLQPVALCLVKDAFATRVESHYVGDGVDAAPVYPVEILVAQKHRVGKLRRHHRPCYERNLPRCGIAVCGEVRVFRGHSCAACRLGAAWHRHSHDRCN